MITPSSYLTQLGRVEKDASDMVGSYSKDPNPENLHAMRTASRRMLTIFQLLPGEARQGKPQTYVEEFENLLKSTRKARHLDILLSKLPSDHQNKTTERLANRLRKIREASLRPARRLATNLKDTPLPEIEARNVSESALQTRFSKTAENLTSLIQESLPDVVKDKIKRKQLQELRQESRKLRYLLEISGGPDNAEKLSALRSWQELLAAIHDDDTFIQQLQDGRKMPQIKALIDQASKNRSENYQKFRSLVEEQSAFKTKN